MRFVIVGAGAVGGTFGALLAKGGEDVFFVARGAHLAAMKSSGLAIEGPNQNFTVQVQASDDPRAAKKADVLVVSVKAYDTRTACEACRPIVTPDTTLLTLQNGLGNVERLASMFPGNLILPGVVYVASEITRPGVIRWDTAGRIIIGESPRSAEIAQRFVKSGAGCQVVKDIDQAIWEKLVANAVFNVLATVEGCELGDLLKEPRREIAEKAIDELAAVGASQGIVVRPSARETCWAFCQNFPTFKTSTQQDKAHGKTTEAEALNGELVKLGRKAGLEIPTLELLYKRLTLISALAGAPPSRA